MARKFRHLRPDEIELRVAQCTDKGVQLLLYKTARTDAALLDEVYPDAWQNDFKVIDGKMYGGIGIKVNSEWLWRWDCGTESNTEAEKGEASDAFKRAGFKWGIGAELYSSPFVWIKNDACTIEINERTKRPECKDRFKVTGIGYDENDRISFLAIDNTKRHCSAFTYGKEQQEDDVPDKDELAARSDERMAILELVQGNMDWLNKKIVEATNGKFTSMDGMNLTHLKAIHEIVSRVINGAKNEGKKAEN